MRNVGSVIAIATIFFLMLTTSTRAQTLAINGVNLSLGESQTKARADIAAAGMDIHKMGEDSYTVTVKRGDTGDLVGEVAFRKGRLFWIQRDWYLNQTPDDKNALANIFHSATASLLEGNDQATCTIGVKVHDFSPSGGISKTTSIECVSPSHIHTLVLTGTDCSPGCSIGPVSGSFAESIKATTN